MKKFTLLFIGNALMLSGIAQLSEVVEPFEKGDIVTPALSFALAEGDSLWTTGGTTGLNFSQVYLQNWAAGGQSSISVNGMFSWYANYAKDKSTWDNTLDLAYGMLWQGDASGVKTDDKIDFASKYGHKANEDWYYTALVNFRSQFAPGYDNPFAHDTLKNVISNFMAPAYSLVALGMDYKPNENFTIFISPVTIKMTMVNDQNLADAGAFGVEGATYDDLGNLLTAGKNFRSELGGYMKMMYKTDIAENVALQTKLDLFSSYQNNPQNIDVNWETLITMKINEFLSTTITTQVLYDDDVDIARDPEAVAANGIVSGPATQFKEVIAIGFSYKF